MASVNGPVLEGAESVCDRRGAVLLSASSAMTADDATGGRGAEFSGTRTAGSFEALPVDPMGRRIPETLGRYRVLHLVGEGGMGAVYEAEQDRPRRTVALKVIRPGLASARTAAAVRARSAGARRGCSIPASRRSTKPARPTRASDRSRTSRWSSSAARRSSDYADTHRLDTRQRLELIARVCDAVEHAHQRGIIHRDLKPGNILVDETGQPKILDFGVARAHRQRRAGDEADRRRPADRHAGLHESRAGACRSAGARHAQRRLRARRDPVRAAGRPAAVHDRAPNLHEAVRTIREEDPASAQFDQPHLPRRRRDDRRQGAGEGQDAALRVGGGARRRTSGAI